MLRERPVSVLLFVLAAAALAYAVLKVAEGWADWVVFGVIVLTTLGAARAIYERRYPTRKRAYTRESESRFRS